MLTISKPECGLYSNFPSTFLYFFKFLNKKGTFYLKKKKKAKEKRIPCPKSQALGKNACLMGPRHWMSYIPHMQGSWTLTVLNLIFIWHTFRKFRSVLESCNSCCVSVGPRGWGWMNVWGILRPLREVCFRERPQTAWELQCEKQSTGQGLTDVMKGWC
jgi:hypothetical protein